MQLRSQTRKENAQATFGTQPTTLTSPQDSNQQDDPACRSQENFNFDWRPDIQEDPDNSDDDLHEMTEDPLLVSSITQDGSDWNESSILNSTNLPVLPSSLASNQFKIMTWNVNKQPALLYQLETAIETCKPALIHIQETNLTNAKSTPCLKNYYCVRKDRPLEGPYSGGGLLTFIEKSTKLIDYKVEKVAGSQDKEAEIIFVKLKMKFGTVNAINVYRNSPSCRHNWQHIVDTFVQENPADLTVLAGDINARCAISGYNPTNEDGDKFEDWVQGSNFTHCPFPKPSHWNAGQKSWTSPDQVLYEANFQLTTELELLTRSTSDHRPIVTTFQSDEFANDQNASPNLSQIYRTRRNFKKRDEAKFIQSLNDSSSEFLKSKRCHSDTTGKVYLWMCRAIKRASKISTPAGNYGDRSRPKDSQISAINAEINEIDDAIADRGDDPDIEEIDKILELQKSLREIQKEASLSHLEDLIKQSPWRAITRLKSPNLKSEKSKIQLEAENKIFVDKSTHPHPPTLFLQRHTLKEKLQSSERKHNNPNSSKFENFISGNITRSELKNAARNLKLRKAPGPDNIYNEDLRLALMKCDKFVQVIWTLFNRILREGDRVPRGWKKALVIPIFKGEDEDGNSLYRPISLLSNIGKLFESIVNNRLVGLIERFHPERFQTQFGFRPGRSTAMVNQIIQELSGQVRQRHESLIITSLDFSRAYDSANGIIVCDKLMGLIGGCNYRIGKTILDFLSHRQIATIGDGHRSKYQTLTLGLGQGSRLATTLFIILVSDIFEQKIIRTPAGHSLGLQFADDSYNFNYGKDLAEITKEQHEDFAKIQIWAAQNGMSLNQSKTKIQIVTGKKEANWPAIRPTGKRVNSIKILGVETSRNEQFASLIEKLKSSMGMLRRLKTLKVRGAYLMNFFKAVTESHVRFSGPALYSNKITKRQQQQVTTAVKNCLCIVLGCYRHKTSPKKVFECAGANHPMDTMKAAFVATHKALQFIPIWKELLATRPSTIRLVSINLPSLLFEDVVEKSRKSLVKKRLIPTNAKVKDPPETWWRYQSPINTNQLNTKSSSKTHESKERVESLVKEWRQMGHDIVWTDGGCDPKKGIAAAGCAIERTFCEEIEYEEIAVEVEGNTAQAAEAVAFKTALEWLRDRPTQRQAHILTDSYSTILALNCVNIRDETMQDCFKLLKGLPCVNVMHVPSHMGIIGNEIADSICTTGLANAKKITPLLPPQNPPLR